MMKKIILSLSLCLLTLTAPAFAADKAVAKKECSAKMAVATVDGMVCDFCAQGLIKLFMKEDAVEKVDIDLTTKKVSIAMKPGKNLDDAVIKKQVDYSGYKLTGLDHTCAKS